MHRSLRWLGPHGLYRLLLAGLGFIPLSAAAATLTVNSITDALIAADNECTLREAIVNANEDTDTTAGDCAAGSGTDVIDVPAGTYVLTTGALDIASDLVLRGTGANVTVIRPDPPAGVIAISGAVAALERLTLTGGAAAPLGYGAIASISATVTVSDCVVSHSGGCFNYWNGENSCTGAINQYEGTLVLRRSAVVDNLATGIVVNGGGCGEICPSAAVTRIENSTISRNVGRLLHSIGYADYRLPAAIMGSWGGSVEVLYSTVADNYLQPSPRPVNTSPALSGSSLRLKGSIFSNPAVANCSASPMPSAGHNLDSDGTCGLTEATDLSGVDPLLGPLQDNGGPTPTHALKRGSPAIDAIPVSDCTFDDDGNPATPEVALARDQRGAARPVWAGARCDIGAYERTACADGLDNDSDGTIDFDGGATAGLAAGELRPRDPQCATALGARERPGCGLGFELVLLAPLLARLARRRRR